jgi:Barstar (barnase inhibitor)
VTPQVVELSGTELIGAAAFHETFSRVFGFLEGYGRNMDAWIDCMGYLRDPDIRMTKFYVGKHETLTLLIRDYETLRDGAPKQWAGLIECSAVVNRREIEAGHAPVLAMAF